MEIKLMATFTSRDQLVQTAELLRLQGVLDIQFNDGGQINSDYQANSYLQSIDSIATEPSYALTVRAEKSRYRQAEDTIIKYGGQLHGSIQA